MVQRHFKELFTNKSHKQSWVTMGSSGSGKGRKVHNEKCQRETLGWKFYDMDVDIGLKSDVKVES